MRLASRRTPQGSRCVRRGWEIESRCARAGGNERGRVARAANSHPREGKGWKQERKERGLSNLESPPAARHLLPATPSVPPLLFHRCESSLFFNNSSLIWASPSAGLQAQSHRYEEPSQICASPSSSSFYVPSYSCTVAPMLCSTLLCFLCLDAPLLCFLFLDF